MESFDEVIAHKGAVSVTTLTEDYSRAQQRAFLAKSSLIVLLGTLASRIFGFFREVVVAAYFGNGTAVDAYRVAYMIPNLFLQLFSYSAIGSAFIPVITKYLTENKDEDVNIVASSVANFLFLFFVVIIGAGIIFAPQLTKSIAPGYISDPAKYDLTVTMTRIIFPCILFLGISGFVMGMLHSYNHFLAPAFAPTFFNLLVISAIIILTRGLGPLSLAIGVTLGALAQLAFQIPFPPNERR